MATTCFFCQNLLSDFIEGILPASRHEELKKHLGECRECDSLHKDLLSTLDLLKNVPKVPLPGELATRIASASETGRKGFFSRTRVSRAVLVAVAAVFLLFGVVLSLPQVFPWANEILYSSDEGHFVRYHPLNQGAAEVIDEYANWLHVREPFSGSVWEEGGLSPEEFEKTFQMKGTKEPMQ